MRTSITASLLVLAALGTGCGRLRAAPESPAATASSGEWEAVLAQIRIESAAGRFIVADHVLTDFASRRPASAEAVEAGYWRALLKLDPSNSSGGPKESVALLDAYIASPREGQHRTEAVTLRRVAVAMGRTSSASAPAPPAIVVAASRADDKARDEEISKLKEELARANAELERIRRRLAAPKP
ncbi:MAG: hypothetical protein H0W68_12020 [Gemmatimonadaceae bacterium]|nr:hypothetical protein [Gemmatimonadaceae bacterium]